MFSSLAKRSNYKVIAEEEENIQGQINSSKFGQNPPSQLEETEEPEEEEEQDGTQSMFESAPPSHHGIAVSIKYGGEKDTELQRSRDDPGQWDHIKDIDQFFAYIYEYYQHKGFTCIAFRYLFSLLRFAFVVLFSTFLLQCVDYDVLFYNRNTTLDGVLLPPKRRIQDAFIPQCSSHLNPLVSLALLFATAFWLVHFIRICYRLIQFYEIKQFFGTQLQIPDAEIQNLSWSQVVQKLCLVQQRLHLIVNKESISSLDIYQRILRHKNYFVALVYYDILPPPISLPLLGRERYLSTGLRFNLEWLLFWGPWSPWKSTYELKDDYKDPAMLPKLSLTMQRTVAIMAFTNLLFFPFVFIYQLLFKFFSYCEHFQRDPTVFGMRKYSNYGREKLRHFNEMDHELDDRLNRSYEFAARYTDQFISPLAKIMARNAAFMAASFFVVLCALTAYDEDTLKIEHVTTMMTITGGIVLLCRVFIPNENLVLCQQFLMRQIVANLHYAPKSWLRDAHSTEIHKEFTQIFRLKVEILMEEVLSPLLTPFILYFCIWKRVPELVTFLHEHTVHVDGLGDVCSLAQMDITRDGDIRLASLNQSVIVQPQSDKDPASKAVGRRNTVYGKVELSLLNFATQNPDWSPPKMSAEFIQNVKELVSLEIPSANTDPNIEYDQHSNQKQTSSMDAQTLAFVQAGCAQMPLNQMTDLQQGLDSSSYIFQQFGPRPEGVNSMVGSKVVTSSMITSRQAQYPHQQGQTIGDVPLQTFSTSTTTAINNGLYNSQQTLPPPLASSSAFRDGSLPMSNSTSNTTQHGSTSYNNNMLLNSNSRLLASSFITPSPLAAIVQPRAVQENNLRATEMSLHALAVNHMLFLNSKMEQPMQLQQQSRLLATNRMNNNPNRGGYGAIMQQQQQQLVGSFRRGGSRYGGTAVMDSLAESNIWAVPAETSQIQMQRQNAGIMMEEEEEQHAGPPLPLSEE